MRYKEIIKEIDYADAIRKFRADISGAEIVGTMQHRDIVLLQDSNHEIYIMRDEDGRSMMSYVALSKHLIDGYHPINQLENVSGIPGSVTTIIAFLVANKRYKLVLDRDEGLTDDGITWLLKLIKSGGRGFTVTDNTGKFPDYDVTHDEWKKAKYMREPGGTSIFIENRVYKPGIKEDGLIKSSYRILFDKEND